MSGYEITEEDIQGMLRYLKAFHPENANRELAEEMLRHLKATTRRFVLCSEYSRPMLGSASRGKSGKHYPAYHCSNHGHYYRVPKQELEDTVKSFISNLTVSGKRIDTV